MNAEDIFLFFLKTMPIDGISLFFSMLQTRVNVFTDENLKYFFLIFLRKKKNLTFHADRHQWRQFV